MRRALLNSRWRTAKIYGPGRRAGCLDRHGRNGGLAGTTTGPWSQTDYNAAQTGRMSMSRSSPAPLWARWPSSPGHNPPARRHDWLPTARHRCSSADWRAAVCGGQRAGFQYNPATGTVIWQRTPDPTFSVDFRSLAVAGGLVIVGELYCGSVSSPEGVTSRHSTPPVERLCGRSSWSPRHSVVLHCSTWQCPADMSLQRGVLRRTPNVVSVHRLTTGALAWYDSGDCGAGGSALVVAQQVISGSCDQNDAPVLSRAPSRHRRGGLSRPGAWGLQRGDTDGRLASHLYATNPNGTVVSLNPLTGKWRSRLARGGPGARRRYLPGVRGLRQPGRVCPTSITSGSGR